MKEADFIRQLKAEQPAVDADAKARTLALAMAEFDSAQLKTAEHKKKPNIFQGFLKRLRLTSTQPSRGDENRMKKLSANWYLGGFGSVATVVTAYILVAPQIQFPVDPTLPPAAGELAQKPAPQALTDSAPSAQAKQEAIALKKSQAERKEASKVFNDSAEYDAQEEVAVIEEVLVTGIRASLENATEARREASGVVSAISAEDIGTLPNIDAAKSLMRMPAASIAPAAKMQSRPIAHKAKMADAPIQVQPQAEHRDQFAKVAPNSVKTTREQPVSTFSIDVDTAAYSFVRRQLNSGVLPRKEAVRTEEMLNYFAYDYPVPNNKSTPFATQVAITDAPWSAGKLDKKLLHIGIKGYEVSADQQPKSNLVFLLDVSGSMNSPDKLPLVKQSMDLLLSQLRPDDTVAIVVYAGAAGTVLEPTKAKEKTKIMDALNRLQAGGGTAGAQGIERAYELAERNFNKAAVNRIILATDGDFNVGINNPDALKGYVERKREKGIYLSVLGFGRGNYNDHLMQELAQNGNGIAAYIDTLSEAQKVLVHEATSSLFPIANDVKIQLEFNPSVVSEYRLLGYETRALKREDFNNDKVDAGDIGAGHTVTAIYEIVLANAANQQVDALRYGADKTQPASAAEYGFLKLRYKLPGETQSRLIEQPITQAAKTLSPSMQKEIGFATAVAGFAELLKGGQYQGDWSYQQALDLAQANKGADLYGYRTEFVQLVRKAKMAKAM